MSRYDDILKRNEQLVDNVYEINEEIIDLAYENEELSKENEELFVNNEELIEQNTEMKKGIAELHKSSVRRGRPRQKQVYTQQVMYTEQPQQNGNNCNVSFKISEKTKKVTMFSILVFLVLLLGLGIEPGTAITYESLLDCYLELVFNLYNICILGAIGFILRKIWKKF